MEFLLGFIYWAILVLLLQVLIGRVCARTRPLRQWQHTLHLTSLIWCGAAVLKKAYLDDVFQPIDAVFHETIAREVAELLRNFHFSEAIQYFSIGNPAYRLLLGLFYAVTDAPEVITYTVNGALGFWALLALLEVLCIHSECRRLPATVVYLCMLLPSGLLWTTTNLKEGPILWGICMTLYWTCPRSSGSNASKQGLPFLGMVVLGLLRPHIAFIWIATISFMATLRSRKIGLFFLTCAGSLGSLFLLKTMLPEVFEAAIGDGITATLGNRYEQLTDNDNLVSGHFVQSKPTPVVTGLFLILFRPWPTEITVAGEVLAGIEVWGLAMVGFSGWCRLQSKHRHWKHPSILGMILGLLLFSFFFSYMYNMGLVVRQRLMAFPAMLFIYFWPMIYLKNRFVKIASGAKRQHAHRRPLAPLARPTIVPSAATWKRH